MANSYLTRTYQSGGNRKKWTMSMWVKRSALGSTNILFQTYVSTYTFCPFDTNNRLQFQDGNGGEYVTTMKFMDTNAWYHIVVAIDTDLATANDRYKFYVNGERITAFDTSTPPSQGYEGEWNKAQLHNIGRHHSAGNYHNGLMSHIHFCDGYQYQASDFGETDSVTGEWKIKTAPSVSYGTTGFFTLKDGNSVTDQSPNSNDWTANGTLTKTEDCPSNVFATFNAEANNCNAVLSNGNTTVSHSSTSWKRALSNLGHTSGKWYWEVKRNNSNTPFYKFGMVEDFGQTANMPSHEHHADNQYGWAWYVNGGNIELRTSQAVISGYSQSDLGNTNLGNGDILCIALDLDNGRLHARKNDGSWLKSGDPANNTGGYAIANWSAGKLYIPACSVYQNATCEHNFGNGYFGTTAVSSAGTNASNIGIFEYDVPTGFTAWSTKGLNE